MAARPKGYGMTREIGEKLDAKYSAETEANLIEWICGLASVPAPATGKDNFGEWLKSGVVLKLLVDAIGLPESQKYTVNTKTADIKLKARRQFSEQENISKFLTAATNYFKLSKFDLFQTVDLYEQTNLAQVQTCLVKLSSAASTMKQGIPGIGVKLATENKREFDEQQQKEMRNVIGLQMGTNQVASQKGMTSYGMGRQIINK